MGLHGRNFFEPFSDDGSVSSFERRSVGIRMSKLKMLIENIILFCLYSFQ